ncbi:hypothetical protein OV203_03440 [Nannocystis sp. ILAH1]|uniref:hypothetical protein n=1 Tax=Nannocystis sp. ILAH1 TaxID=2996789 RepID=UPI00226D5A25|nr:hypothetical protein [Nannocystis sp. ILAH1]MCY0986166.1 hypothetical protein [Nannocystis sp. ILAH1]
MALFDALILPEGSPRFDGSSLVRLGGIGGERETPAAVPRRLLGGEQDACPKGHVSLFGALIPSQGSSKFDGSLLVRL